MVGFIRPAVGEAQQAGRGTHHPSGRAWRATCAEAAGRGGGGRREHPQQATARTAQRSAGRRTRDVALDHVVLDPLADLAVVLGGPAGRRPSVWSVRYRVCRRWSGRSVDQQAAPPGLAAASRPPAAQHALAAQPAAAKQPAAQATRRSRTAARRRSRAAGRGRRGGGRACRPRSGRRRGTSAVQGGSSQRGGEAGRGG